jgi:hypothetical protein
MAAPGSFTKNLGWNQTPPGLNRLHVVIRAGFGGVAQSVTREQFRTHCGIADRDRQLIPLNFFLHNTVMNGANYVTVDELVRHAISNPHSRRFDHLALFSLHLARMGRRVGVAGDPHGAEFANEFVRVQLWNNGGWARSQLTEQVVEATFATSVQATADTIHKCMTNYLFIAEMMGLRGGRTPVINSHAEEWVGPGLFMAFDRYSVDRRTDTALGREELLAMVRTDELHKLMGITQTYLDSTSSVIADEYLQLGGLARITGQAVLNAAGVAVISSPVAASVGDTPIWSDEDAQDAALVERRLQEILAQMRNPRNVRELKELYQDACVFCGRQLVVGVNPSKHYSEAAHIKPVGNPHNGPDRKDNMIILCPEHHLQFDRGVLRIERHHGDFQVISKIVEDPLNGRTLLLRSPHSLDEECVRWHYQWSE